MYNYYGNFLGVNSPLGIPVYVPLVFSTSANPNLNNIPEDVREKIEMHADEFKTDKQLRDFIRDEMLRS